MFFLSVFVVFFLSLYFFFSYFHTRIDIEAQMIADAYARKGIASSSNTSFSHFAKFPVSPIKKICVLSARNPFFFFFPPSAYIRVRLRHHICLCLCPCRSPSSRRFKGAVFIGIFIAWWHVYSRVDRLANPCARVVFMSLSEMRRPTFTFVFAPHFHRRLFPTEKIAPRKLTECLIQHTWRSSYHTKTKKKLIQNECQHPSICESLRSR